MKLIPSSLGHLWCTRTLKSSIPCQHTLMCLAQCSCKCVSNAHASVHPDMGLFWIVLAGSKAVARQDQKPISPNSGTRKTAGLALPIGPQRQVNTWWSIFCTGCSTHVIFGTGCSTHAQHVIVYMPLGACRPWIRVCKP
jgi:hypothetical protein